MEPSQAMGVLSIDISTFSHDCDHTEGEYLSNSPEMF